MYIAICNSCQEMDLPPLHGFTNQNSGSVLKRLRTREEEIAAEDSRGRSGQKLRPGVRPPR
jgi:hypothetical protein